MKSYNPDGTRTRAEYARNLMLRVADYVGKGHSLISNTATVAHTPKLSIARIAWGLHRLDRCFGKGREP
jgi:hypothetical protein